MLAAEKTKRSLSAKGTNEGSETKKLAGFVDQVVRVKRKNFWVI